MISDRLGLPFLATAQAQKEMTHNEALAIVDIAVQAVVVAVAPAAVPAAPSPGQCWIVGTAPTGAWAGHPGAIAGWTTGGWRFIEPFEGMSAWSVADGAIARRTPGGWVIGKATGTSFSIAGLQVVGARQPHIPAPTSGGTVDAQARAAIANMLSALEAHGLLAAS